MAAGWSTDRAATPRPMAGSGNGSGSAQTLLAAWGGRAVPCAQEYAVAECAASMADGSSGGAAVCMRFSAGAVDGAVPVYGLFCACAEFRSGQACNSFDPLVFAPVAAFLLLIALSAWLVRFAQRAWREIELQNKQGNGELQRVLRIAQAGAVLTGIYEMGVVLRFISPLPYDVLTVLIDIFTACTPMFYLAMIAYLSIIFRELTGRAEGRDSTAARDTRLAHAYVVTAAVCIFVTSRTQFKQATLLFFVFLGVAIAMHCALATSRVIRDTHSSMQGCSSSVDAELIGALRRILRTLRGGALYLVGFIAVRVVFQLVIHAQAPVQGMIGYYPRLINRWVNFVNGSYALYVCTQYVGGAAWAESRKQRSRTARVTAEPQLVLGARELTTEDGAVRTRVSSR